MTKHISSGFFESDGLKIYYEIFGQGKPLILVHGWGSDLKQNWVDTGWAEVLLSIRQVIAIDCQGHGRSDKPHNQKLYSYSIMASDVIHLMDHLRIAKADLFGYSMGSFMIIYLLGHYRDRITSVIMGGIGDETEESMNPQFIADALLAIDPSQITNPLGQVYRSFVESNPNNDLKALALSALQMWPEGFPVQIGGEYLADVDIPVLIINGEEDYPYVESDEKLAAAIPSSKLIRIPRKNHLTVVNSRRFKKEVLAFLKHQ